MELNIKDLRKQYRSLVDERERLMPIWKELANNFLPLKRVLLEENYEPTEVYLHMGTVNKFITDNTPIKATRVLDAGMQSGMTSPAKVWFKLGYSDPFVERLPNVKEWLESANNTMFDAMSRSNFYLSTQRAYLEVAVFGTLVMLILEDDEKGLRTITLPIGSYVLAANAKNEIDVLYRRLFMTASQMVNEYGEDRVSSQVLEAYKDPARKDTWFSVIHAILPNSQIDRDKDDMTGMEYTGVYFEERTNEESGDAEAFLETGGFREKPFVAARWDVTGDSVYGDSPAMDVLCFARGLQSMKSTVYKAEQKNADPAMNVPPGMKSASTNPGVRNYQANPNERITPTADIRPNTNGTILLIQDDRKQVTEGLFNDLFRALSLAPNERMTATEVMERVTEGLRQLGPVLERLQFEFLDPIIDRVFAILYREGQFEPPPAELEGEILKTEYISPLAQAQKAVGTDAILKLTQAATVMAQVRPDVLDNLDWDQMITKYAELVGVSVTIVNDSAEVGQIRELRAEQQAALLAQQQESQNVDNLKKMSETQVTESENAIQALDNEAA